MNTPAHNQDTPALHTRDLCHIALFSVLMAVCAWISIPGPVPVTLQTFAIFTALVTLDGKRGTFSVIVYLLMGAIGLPVFSLFQGGAGVLLGATGGYILGFLAGALLYWLITAHLGSSLPVVIGSCATGLAACYVFGTAWFLAVYTHTTGPMTLQAALMACVVPFILPDALKIALAIFFSRRLRRAMQHERKNSGS